jgi:hypothetical protein
MTNICAKLREGLPSLDPVTNPAWRDTLSLRQLVQHEFQLHGHLSPATFEAVLDWKLRKQRQRTEKHRNGITPDLIRLITSCFAQAKHEDELMEREIRLHVLCALPGVGLGIASAILTLAHPADYGIIDFRVWKVLYQEDKKGFTIGDYRKYLDDLRKIASELECNAQEVDFLLWKEFEKPETNRPPVN